MADIVFVNPAFETSYWGLEHALPFFGKRANVPPASLPLLAALTPAEHQVTLVDESIEELDFDRLAQADIVGLTGMSVQRSRIREIMRQLKQRDTFAVVGGPWVTVEENYFDGLADAIFVGEAEETWPRFLDEWQHGRHSRRYEQTASSDMTVVPTPRFDLLNMQQYMFGSLQFSRGCPFQCEFCDIIVTFGRRPRLKTATQVFAELEALRAQKTEMVFVVDDNLIGNKKAIKVLLCEVIDWQRKNGYPLMFFTEASIDLAEDAELMQLMVEANFVSVFIGIESPNEESLVETKKFQNVRKGNSLVDQVITVQRAGLDVWCGMIIGFDHDDSTIFSAQEEFLGEARIAHAMIGMLHAIPKTPLYDRLAGEDRLDVDEDNAFGTNVIPLRMSREELTDGYTQLMQKVYSPESFFQRLDDLFFDDDFHFATARARYWRSHPFRWFKSQSLNLLRFAGVYSRLMRFVQDEALKAEYRRRIGRLLKKRRDPAVLFSYVVKCAMHFHHHRLANAMSRSEKKVVSSF